MVETKNRIERCKLRIVRKKKSELIVFFSEMQRLNVIYKLRIERKSEFGDKKNKLPYFILWRKPQNKNVNLY